MLHETGRKLPRPVRLLLGFLIAGIVCIVLWRPLQLQLWNDEVYSLLRFQRVPLLQTLTDYHETNNHVLYNFVQNLWLRAIGSPAVPKLLAEPWLVRIPSLIYAVVTALCLFFGLLRRFGAGIAMLGLALLLSSVPYFNFALQARAYGLLMMTATLQLFAFLSYLELGGARRLWIQMLWGFILFYAHPAGLYLAIGWGLATLLCFSGDLRRASLTRQRAWYAVGAWTCGVILAGFAYLPIMQQILQNPWVGQKTVTPGSFIRDTFFSVLRQLAGTQWWLLALVMVGIIASRFLKTAPAERRLTVWAILIVVCTYLMPLFRLDAAPQRTFTMLIPVIVFGLAVAVAGLLRSWPAKPVVRILPIIITAALAIQFPLALRQRNAGIEAAARDGIELSSIETAYYLHRFNPLPIALRARLIERESRPVFTAIAYRQELPHYLEAFGVPWREFRTLQQRTAAPDTAIVITSMVAEFRRRYGSELDFRVIDSSGGFYELLEVRRK